VSESIFKLQPDRTIALRGFDHLGASAALHNATATGFSVSGAFRDPADFAVVMLYDADDFYNHPHWKWLPDFDFDGLVLQFDVEYQGLMPLNSRKYASIDWPYLDILTPEGTPGRIRLSDHAEVIATPDSPASTSVTIAGAGFNVGDGVALWYQNMAFEYTVPGKVETEYPFYAQGAGAQHFISVSGRTYTYTEAAGDGSAQVAGGLVALMAADPEAAASIGSEPHKVRLRARLATGAAFAVTASGQTGDTLHHIQTSTVAAALAALITNANYAAAGAPYALAAAAAGETVHITTGEGGYDANFLRVYSTARSERLTATAAAEFSGGASTAKLRVTIDFAALGFPSIRQMWLTLAPRLQNTENFTATEWRADFSNWTVTGPESKRLLKFASGAAVRAGSHDKGVRYEGAWVSEEGFFQDGFAMCARQSGASVRLRYHSPAAHELWLGTSLYGDRGAARVFVDGAQTALLDARLGCEPAAAARRKVSGALEPGEHEVRIETTSDSPFYFDYLEAAAPGAPAPGWDPQSFVTPALDYSTDHAYKLPPARIWWLLDKMGCQGALNEYLGVFWWNERRREGGSLPRVTLTFSGTFTAGMQAFVDIGGQVCGKTLLQEEPAENIARHFEFLINATYVGVFARAGGASLEIFARSASPAYEFAVSAWTENGAATVSGGGMLAGGSMGTWVIDPAAANGLNAGARAWHADLYREAALRSRQVTTAISMELVHPPGEFAARFADGQPVMTAVGFGSLVSTHCAFGGAVLEYQKKVLGQVAALQAGAGLTPEVQCGEFCWWYFTNKTAANPGGGMAYYDAGTQAAAQAALGRPLHVFVAPTDDPGVNSGADAAFLRARLRDHVGAIAAHLRNLYPTAKIEVLYPHDVNHPSPQGVHSLGGALNHAVNLPLEWASKVSSGLDRFKVEALDYSAWSRNADLAAACLRFPLEIGWPAGDVKGMIAVFRGGGPWRKELGYARELGLSGVNLWAFDHVCLHGLEWEERGARKAFLVG
jgi:hypothetical protein